ncbi:Ldh family oxidoreductase [Mesorhizobium sp.]|uniref:Ldh family oxidoreductase n=1 Tax=Mesorhizobium sp. TaxID=1871066 RepID=UPI0025D0425F|nr:Ldh family oxidoreductase [Mesorhizobium sp.]
MNDVSGGAYYPVGIIQDFLEVAFRKIGMPMADADFLASVIVASELAGHECHGMRRVPEYIEKVQRGSANPAGRFEVTKDLGAVVLGEGHRAFGHIVLRDVTDIAIARAKSFGVAAVAARGSESAGRLADYCARAADAGVATIIFANDSGGFQHVAPPGAREARMSTNPIAFGVPRSSGSHLVLDMATSSVAYGRLSETIDRGEPIPKDWVNSSGLLKHFGGVKGFGLAVVVEAMAGALSGGGTVNPEPSSEDQATLMIALDVAHFRPLEEFVGEVERFTTYVKDVALDDGAAPVRMPGESASLNAAKVMEAGILVRPVIARRLSEALKPYGLDLPK